MTETSRHLALEKIRVHPDVTGHARVRVTHPDDGTYAAKEIAFPAHQSVTLAEILAEFEDSNHPGKAEFTPEAVRAELIRRGFTEHAEDRMGFGVYKAALGPEIVVELRGVDLLPFNPGEGPKALLGDYEKALKAVGYHVSGTGREVILRA